MNRLLLAIVLVAMTALTVHAQDISGIWKGELELGTVKLELIFHFDSDKCTLDVPAQGAMGIPVTVNSLSADNISLKIPQLQITYNGKRSGESISGMFVQLGKPFFLMLKPGEAAKINRPQEPKGPFAYTTKDVTFTNSAAGVTLAGTLTYPVDFKAKKGVPVVLMVTGSGPENRDEELFSHKPFFVIADYLATHGIASLRYDDRGVGQSTGKHDTCTTKDFADDAKAGVAYLKSLKEFGQVGILGHSEGGMIAFKLASEGVGDFIVAMAAPGVKGDTLLAEQMNALLSLVDNENYFTAAQARANAKGKSVWTDYFLDYDPTSDIQRTHIPTMAINGTKDMQVSAQTNLKNIKLLMANGHKKNLFREYEGLNHMFQHCTKGIPTEYFEIEETISPEVLADIANWISGL